MRKQGGLAALLLALAGCVSTPPLVGEPAPMLKDERQEKAYQETLARYTDRAELYSGFDTILFAAATLQTPSFREARVRRSALFQALTRERVQASLAQELAEAERAHEFLLGVHVNNYRHDDFDRASSIWNLVLVMPGGGEVRPLQVERLGRADMTLRAFYPYLGAFWVAYRVRFPTTREDGSPVIPPGVERVALRMASSLGKVEMRVHTR
jgi:hypothetical protein